MSHRAIEIGLSRSRESLLLGGGILLLSVFVLFSGPGEAAAQTEVPTSVSPIGTSGAGTPPLADDMQSARGLAMGLGARASAASTSAIYYNSAGLTQGRHYHIGSQTTWDPSSGRFGAGASVVDGFSAPVAAGLAYRYVMGNDQSGHEGMSGRLAIAVPLGDMLAIGVSGRYLSYWREGQPEGTQPWVEGFTMDAAIRFSPVPGLHIAALGYNFIDLGTPYAPIQVGGSASYTIDSTFTLAFDMLADFTTFRQLDGSMRPEAQVGGAVEFFTGEVPIRAGYFYDTGRDQHFVTAGLGWMNADVAIETGLRQQVVEPYGTSILLSFKYLVH